MQRLQRRAQYAVANTARRQARESARHHRIDQYLKDRQTAQDASYRRQIKSQAKRNAWEAWHLGPLAPNRKMGTDEEEREYREKELERKYLDNPELDSRKRRRRNKKEAARKQVQGRLLRKPFGMSFKLGERVVCVADKGTARKDRGRIAKVVQVNVGEKTCLVEGLNMVPTNIRPSASNPTPPQYYHLPIRIHQLRAIRTITNPTTKAPEDIILGGLLPHHRQMADTPVLDPRDPWSDSSNTHFSIELAKARAEKRARRKETEAEAEKQRAEKSQTHADDTPRYDVDARTWTPTLLRAPLPFSVIEELRGKYSEFRTRHTTEFVEKVTERERRRKARASYFEHGGGMLEDPMKTLSLADQARRRREWRKKGDVPTAQVLERLGKEMVQKGVVPSPLGTDDGGSEEDWKGRSVAVTDAEDRAVEQVERRIEREESKSYWPVKGWKERQRRQLPVELMMGEEDPSRFSTKDAVEGGRK